MFFMWLVKINEGVFCKDLEVNIVIMMIKFIIMVKGFNMNFMRNKCWGKDVCFLK